jgi:class 3 adenylate cyclase
VAFCPNCGLSAPAASRFCPNCGAPISEPAQPSEERKLATVLFADLVGSTKLASSQDAERTRSLLNRFYDAMATEISDAGGTVEKFAGDAVINCGGVPRCGTCRACRELAALTREPQREFKALPIPSPNPVSGFSLYAKPSRDAHGRSVDQLLEQLGIR